MIILCGCLCTNVISCCKFQYHHLCVCALCHPLLLSFLFSYSRSSGWSGAIRRGAVWGYRRGSLLALWQELLPRPSSTQWRSVWKLGRFLSLSLFRITFFNFSLFSVCYAYSQSLIVGFLSTKIWCCHWITCLNDYDPSFDMNTLPKVVLCQWHILAWMQSFY